jgi:lactoylglutathione lyase
MNHLSHVIYYVENVKETVEFFERAFGLKKHFIDPTGEYAQLDTGSTALGFASESLASKNLPHGFQKLDHSKLPFGIEISLCAKDVEASFNHALKNGAVLVAPLEKKPWGQTTGFVRTPQGILVEICSEMAQE